MAGVKSAAREQLGAISHLRWRGVLAAISGDGHCLQ